MNTRNPINLEIFRSIAEASANSSYASSNDDSSFLTANSDNSYSEYETATEDDLSCSCEHCSSANESVDLNPWSLSSFPRPQKCKHTSYDSHENSSGYPGTYSNLYQAKNFLDFTSSYEATADSGELSAASSPCKEAEESYHYQSDSPQHSYESNNSSSCYDENSMVASPSPPHFKPPYQSTPLSHCGSPQYYSDEWDPNGTNSFSYSSSSYYEDSSPVGFTSSSGSSGHAHCDVDMI